MKRRPEAQGRAESPSSPASVWKEGAASRCQTGPRQGDSGLPTFFPRCHQCERHFASHAILEPDGRCTECVDADLPRPLSGSEALLCCLGFVGFAMGVRVCLLFW